MNVAYNPTSKSTRQCGTDEELKTGITTLWFQRSGSGHRAEEDAGSYTFKLSLNGAHWGAWVDVAPIRHSLASSSDVHGLRRNEANLCFLPLTLSLYIL